MGFQSTALAFSVPGLSGPQKAVLVALAHCRNEQSGQCNPGQDHLCEMTSLSARAVRDALNVLEHRGLIERSPVYVNRRRTSDRYTLRLPKSLPAADAATGTTRPYRQEMPQVPARDAAIDTGTRRRVTGREQELKGGAPSKYCSKHPEGTSEPCGACGDARQAHRLFEAEQRARQSAASRPVPVGQCPAVMARGAHRFVQGWCAECSEREVAA